MNTTPKAREFKPLSVRNDEEIAEIIKQRAIPNIGRAIKAANEQAAAVERPFTIRGKLSQSSYENLLRRLCEEKVRGDGVGIECLIARGLQALGVEIHPADLMPDRRTSNGRRKV